MLFGAKIVTLVTDLWKGTAANAITWTEAADEDSFRTVLNKGIVRIERKVAPQMNPGEQPGLFTADQIANPRKRVPVDNFEYWLVVFDERNNEIVRYTPDSDSNAITLRNLWEVVCAKARNTEQKIDSLLRELEAKTDAVAAGK